MIDGIRIGHWTDRDAATGLTVFLLPQASIAAAAVRGQNTGTLNTPVFEPGGAADHADAIVLTGGSSYGLTAAAHLTQLLGGPVPQPKPVPSVLAAVIYDLPLGRVDWPTPAATEHAVRTAVPAGTEDVGTVGAGTGATAGSLDGPAAAMKGGFGRAGRTTAQGATVAAWAVANPMGDVIGQDGRVLAGLLRGGRHVRVVDALADDAQPTLDWGQATTLVVVATDAHLDKRATWRLAHAGHGGIAQAVSPSATGLDGDTAFAVSTATVPVSNVSALEAVAATVTAEAVRDAVRNATTLHDVPALRDIPADDVPTDTV
ncbi:P1 family peptidase [Sciscionella marina]|uniref:P1 family peptidase n=1 Tax=Sciscionella marina TaxID=508770 RepID=UPI000367E119|nr:P1 family peptidase [Sciscionella marina]